jgi:hypothetical protein
MAGGVAQGIGSEFKSQYHKKKKVNMVHSLNIIPPDRAVSKPCKQTSKYFLSGT